MQCHFCFDGQSLPVVDSVVHLGNTLQFNLLDKLDIHLKSMSFIRKANTVLFDFKCTDLLTKMKLCQLIFLPFTIWKLSVEAKLDCEELTRKNFKNKSSEDDSEHVLRQQTKKL